MKVVQDAWKKAGITFHENPYMSLISIFFHDQFSEDENDQLMEYERMPEVQYRAVYYRG